MRCREPSGRSWITRLDLRCSRCRRRLLDDRADRVRLASAVAFALGLLDDDRVGAIRGDVFAVMPGSLVRRLNGPGRFNRVAAAALAVLLDAPAPFRRMVLDRAGKVLSQFLSSTPRDDLLDYVTPIFHPSGTCRMGSSVDSEAVVDASCRVRGVDGLRVVDASIMPTIPTGNTCLPTMMLVEHAAKFIARTLCEGSSVKRSAEVRHVA